MPQPLTKDDVKLGPIGDRILFENELVRVWELAVEPGGNKGLHHHELPYVIVPITGGSVKIEAVDGKVVHAEDKAGEALWREAGEVHDLHNLGDTTYRNVLVEIKQPAKP